MKQPDWIGAGFLGVALLMAASAAWAAPHAQRQNPPSALAEYNAYQGASRELDPQKKLKLLDSFVAEYPDSVLVASAYRDYSVTYFTLRRFPESVEYADKFLARVEESGPGMLPDGLFGGAHNLEGLYLRAKAYFQGCSESTFHTPEAAGTAIDAARQGREALTQWQKPAEMSDQEYVLFKGVAARLFDSVTAIAESDLKGSSPDESCKAALAPDPGKFDRMIDQISSEQSQNPQSR